jgi:hypothetical protein
MTFTYPTQQLYGFRCDACGRESRPLASASDADARMKTDGWLYSYGFHWCASCAHYWRAAEAAIGQSTGPAADPAQAGRAAPPAGGP